MSSEFEVIVVGAGIGGLYGVRRFRDQGNSVLGIEAAPGVGGVWYHNGYPGARVDVESIYYCYYFDADLYREWHWTERYATQPELLAYLNHVADRYDLRRHFRFSTRVTAGRWEPRSGQWVLQTDTGEEYRCRYLVMATGQLSRPRPPDFPGLSDFEGDWVQTARWRDVPIDDRKVAVIGTGSSGVQAITAISKRAEHTYVLQRTAGYILPVANGPSDREVFARVAASIDDEFQRLLSTGGAVPDAVPAGRARDFNPEDQERLLEEGWAKRGLGVAQVFSDFAIDAESNRVLSEFVRRKSRERLADPKHAEVLINAEYGFGVRRVVFDTGYYEAFNGGTVTPFDIKKDPIQRIVPHGIRFASGREIDVDTIVFALGFDAFMGAIEAAGIRNERGAKPTDHWRREPLTFLGLMTTGFPNFFFPTGPGSPATLSSNMCATNVHSIDFIGDLVLHMSARGLTRVEPTPEAVTEWSAHVQEVAQDHLRLRDDNYMVKVAADGARYLIPYIGGVDEYVRRARQVVDDNYRGFDLS